MAYSKEYYQKRKEKFKDSVKKWKSKQPKVVKMCQSCGKVPVKRNWCPDCGKDNYRRNVNQYYIKNREKILKNLSVKRGSNRLNQITKDYDGKMLEALGEIKKFVDRIRARKGIASMEEVFVEMITLNNILPHVESDTDSVDKQLTDMWRRLCWVSDTFCKYVWDGDPFKCQDCGCKKNAFSKRCHDCMIIWKGRLKDGMCKSCNVNMVGSENGRCKKCNTFLRQLKGHFIRVSKSERSEGSEE